MKKILKGARTLIKKEKHELNAAMDKAEKKRSKYKSLISPADSNKKKRKMDSNLSYNFTSKKKPKPAIDDLLLSLKQSGT